MSEETNSLEPTLHEFLLKSELPYCHQVWKDFDKLSAPDPALSAALARVSELEKERNCAQAMADKNYR